jgi:hypothetical protein
MPLVYADSEAQAVDESSRKSRAQLPTHNLLSEHRKPESRMGLTVLNRAYQNPDRRGRA